MHSIAMPAGSTIRLTATVRHDAGVHRWAIQMHGDRVTTETPARAVYGSQISPLDRDQRIDIPAQDTDCRLEVSSQHALGDGEWRADRPTVLDDTPSKLDIGFFNPTRLVSHPDDVLLSFAFTSPHPET